MTESKEQIMKPPPPINITTLNTDSNNSSTTTTTMTWTTFLPELRQEILKYLDENDLAEVSIVSKQCRDDCLDVSLSQRRRAVVKCTPNANKGFHYLHPLAGALLKVPTTSNSYQKSFPTFQHRFTYFKIENPSGLPKILPREAKPIVKGLKMSHVTHLDMSSVVDDDDQQQQQPSHQVVHHFPQVAPSVAKLMTQVAPDVQVLDLSHNQVGTATLADFSRNCKQLSSIRLVGGMLASSITGMDLKQCDSLRELYLDDTMITASAKEENDVFFRGGPNDENSWSHEEICPFHFCLQNLERVSFKGSTYFNMTARKAALEEQQQAITNTNPNPSDSPPPTTTWKHDHPFTQLGLIKFVRNAKNLKWFNSDLTPENIAMLQYERPDVVFVGHENEMI